MGTSSVLEMADSLCLYLSPLRRITFDGFVNYDGRRFVVPYDYTGKPEQVAFKTTKDFRFFYFSVLRGKFTDRLKAYNTLSSLLIHKNLAFAGSQGIGKFHLAMAFRYECCQREMNAYFLESSEFNQRFTDARKHDRAKAAVNGLAMASCLIIDEIGHTVFERENTRLFFDVIDRRYSKESPYTINFMSNKTSSPWREYFSEG